MMCYLRVQLVQLMVSSLSVCIRQTLISRWLSETHGTNVSDLFLKWVSGSLNEKTLSIGQ